MTPAVIMMFMTGVALILSTVNVFLMIATFRRASAWKEGEEAQKLISRVAECEVGVSAVKAQGATLVELNTKVGAVESDVSGLKVRMENVATKADVSRLTAEVNGLEHLIRQTDAGVIRIEQHLMRVNT